MSAVGKPVIVERRGMIQQGASRKVLGRPGQQRQPAGQQQKPSERPLTAEQIGTINEYTGKVIKNREEFLKWRNGAVNERIATATREIIAQLNIPEALELLEEKLRERGISEPKRGPEKLRRVTCYFPEELGARLNAHVKVKGEPRTNIIEHAVRAYLDAMEL